MKIPQITVMDCQISMKQLSDIVSNLYMTPNGFKKHKLDENKMMKIKFKEACELHLPDESLFLDGRKTRPINDLKCEEEYDSDQYIDSNGSDTSFDKEETEEEFSNATSVSPKFLANSNQITVKYISEDSLIYDDMLDSSSCSVPSVVSSRRKSNGIDIYSTNFRKTKTSKMSKLKKWSRSRSCCSDLPKMDLGGTSISIPEFAPSRECLSAKLQSQMLCMANHVIQLHMQNKILQSQLNKLNSDKY